jgi:peptide/nickel transport system substrate-binding protein
MGETRNITRREFLHASGIAIAGALSASCASPTAAPTPTQAEEAAATPTPVPAPSGYSQAPMLEKLVGTGDLPPAAERLSEEPLVIEPIEEIGEYGGTMHVATIRHQIYRPDEVPACRQQLLRMGPGMATATANAVRAYDVSEDARTFTMYLRKGMKWSDGQPVVSDDAVFWYEAIFLNDELTPVKPSALAPGGKPLKVEKIDDYSFAYKFEISHPTFELGSLAHVTGGFGNRSHCSPTHYVKEFHIDYNKGASDIAQQKGYDNWYQCFDTMVSMDENVDVPVYRAFACTQETAEAVFLERNPYFWMVDSEGNQLPYIDEIVMDRVADAEMYNARAVAGEYDFVSHNTLIENYAAYESAAEDGDFRVLLWSSGKGSEVVYSFNMTFDKDPVLRDIFSDVRFRRAMSLAMNRDEINDAIFFGHAEPRQATVLPTSKYFKQEYADAYADFDPDQANELLDEMDLKWDESQEVRMRPDGQPLEIRFDMYQSETPKTAITELVVDYWQAIGVKVDFKSIARNLLSPKVSANEEPMGLWHGDNASDVLFPITPKFYVPTAADSSVWARPWAQWYNTGGESGQEPPEEIKELFDWWDNLKRTLDVEWGHKMLDLQAKKLWGVGTVGLAPHPVIVRNNLRNVPEEGVWTWDNLFGYPHYPEQFFIKKG